ncbi:MAG: BON domain-containing protein [Gammaproteobacteria bacterium]|nr:BON domain-containing protein [Gammaproteobacteria bacterium]MCY4279040.1 BON domain-containing protein [Gammaproteobacteria bacterium]MCY4323519.1 BON domain-containing protein [Gammaproteobacteria bacterium]
MVIPSSNNLRCCALLLVCVTMVSCGNYTGEGRTPGVFIDDAYIESTAADLIGKAHKDFADARLKVVSMEAKVLLAGEVPSQALKTLAEQQVLKIRQVRGVFNELAVSAKPAFLGRANDTTITLKVKTRLLNNPDVAGLRIKVVTVNQVVYLMGSLDEKEGELAGKIASETSGVLKVVKLFEYVQPVTGNSSTAETKE